MLQNRCTLKAFFIILRTFRKQSMSDPLEFKPETPEQALEVIRQNLEKLTREYASGVINSAQFNALYRHHSEKRAVIERMLENNPDGTSWKAVAERGSTMYLRDQFQARLLYYVVFGRGNQTPLLSEGKLTRSAAEQLMKLLQVLWGMKAWRKGLARKSLGDGMWLLVCIGDNGVTLAVYFLQPSTLQTNKLKDVHEDFERANKYSIEKNLPAERMVFPQRALIEKRG
jgi:hypothetical protein